MTYVLEDLSKTLESAYTLLIEATQTAHEATEAVFAAKSDLARERAAILLANAADPKALGSNEAAREATLADLTAPFVASLRTAEAADRKAGNDQALAKLAVEACRAQLRVLEAAGSLEARR